MERRLPTRRAGAPFIQVYFWPETAYRKRKGRKCANTPTPGAGEVRASPPVNAMNTFPDGRPPTVSRTVGGHCYPSGRPYLMILSMSLPTRRVRAPHRAAFIASQNKRLVRLFGNTPPLLPMPSLRTLFGEEAPFCPLRDSQAVLFPYIKIKLYPS
jgi:hypothetical protein